MSELLEHYKKEYEKAKAKLDEIQKVIDGFNAFKKYSLKDHEKAIIKITEILE